MRNIFILALMGSLLGCQTQETAYRMSIKDSLYRDDSLLAINVLQQLNAREKGDLAGADSVVVVEAKGAIKLLTLAKEARYANEAETEDSTVVADSLPVAVEAAKPESASKTTSISTPSVTKPKPKSSTTTSVISSPTKVSSAPTTTPPPVVKTPAPAAPTPPAAVKAEPAKPVEAPKPATPPATPVKQ